MEWAKKPYHATVPVRVHAPAQYRGGRRVAGFGTWATRAQDLWAVALPRDTSYPCTGSMGGSSPSGHELLVHRIYAIAFPRDTSYPCTGSMVGSSPSWHELPPCAIEYLNTAWTTPLQYQWGGEGACPDMTIPCMEYGIGEVAATGTKLHPCIVYGKVAAPEDMTDTPVCRWLQLAQLAKGKKSRP
jgi:hypothetical protein